MPQSGSLLLPLKAEKDVPVMTIGWITLWHASPPFNTEKRLSFVGFLSLVLLILIAGRSIAAAFIVFYPMTIKRIWRSIRIRAMTIWFLPASD